MESHCQAISYELVTALGIKNFRGVFSRDALPNRKHKVERGIVNLDDIMGPGPGT